MNKCTNCGNDNLEIADFCEVCGQTLERAQPGRPAAYAGTATTSTPAIGVGSVQALLRSKSTGKEYLLDSGREAVIGRGDPARGLQPEVELSDSVARAKGVSRSHAKVIFDSGAFYLVDLNSANSTFVNGNRLSPQQAYGLGNGDEVKLGEYELTFSLLG
jgi:hypothetical protein